MTASIIYFSSYRRQGYIPGFVNFISIVTAFMAIGLCLLFVRTEMTYDTWINDYGQAFRLSVTLNPPGSPPIHIPSVSPLLAETLISDPNIEKITRLSRETLVFKKDGSSLSEIIQSVDPNFLDTFGLHLEDGNSAQVLKEPGSVVLTKAAAQKYFGTQSVLGKTLEVNSGEILHVTGILKNVPVNTHLDLNILVSDVGNSTQLGRQISDGTAGEENAYTYFWLKNGIDAQQFTNRLPQILQATPIMPPEQAQIIKPKLTMMPIIDIHLNGFPAGELKQGGSQLVAGIFIVIAAIIVIIVAINYSILCVSRVENRSAEYGLRRSFGASRRQIMFAEFQQNLIVTVSAMLAAGILIWLVLPRVSAFFGQTIVFVPLLDGPLLILPPLIVVLVACIACMVPLTAISRLSLITAARQTSADKKIIWQLLPVIVQFVLSTTIAIVTIIVSAQTLYAIRQSVNIPTNRVYIIDAGSTPLSDRILRSAKHEIETIPEVNKVALSAIVPTNFSTSVTNFVNNNLGQIGSVTLPTNSVDASFFALYGISPIVGRTFSDTRLADDTRQQIIISQAALPLLGFQSAQEAVGKSIAMMSPNGPVPFDVIGIVPNLLMKSIDADVEPLVYVPLGSSGRFVSIEFKSGISKASLNAVEQQWNTITGQSSAQASFLNDRLDNLYGPMEQSRRVLIWLAVVSVVISCLGIFALAALSTIRQRHEVGVRMTLGASRWNIVNLMLCRFLVPVCIGTLVAWPLAYGVSIYWLSTFSSRINIGFWPFFGSSLAIVAFGFIAVIYYIIQLSLMKPKSVLER